MIKFTTLHGNLYAYFRDIAGRETAACLYASTTRWYSADELRRVYEGEPSRIKATTDRTPDERDVEENDLPPGMPADTRAIIARIRNEDDSYLTAEIEKLETRLKDLRRLRAVARLRKVLNKTYETPCGHGYAHSLHDGKVRVIIHFKDGNFAIKFMEDRELRVPCSVPAEELDYLKRLGDAFFAIKKDKPNNP